MLGRAMRLWEMLGSDMRCWDMRGHARRCWEKRGRARRCPGQRQRQRQAASGWLCPPSPALLSPKVPWRCQSTHGKMEFRRAGLNCLPGISGKPFIPSLQSHMKGFLALLAGERPPLSRLSPPLLRRQTRTSFRASPSRRAGGVPPPLPRAIKELHRGGTVRCEGRRRRGHARQRAGGSAAATFAPSSSLAPADGFIFLGVGGGRKARDNCGGMG